jgi:retron-type reverse transcriptase
MSHKTLERLEYLRKSKSNKRWVNNQLYRLMYKEDLYMVAYERMKSKPGNMTAGTDKETLDGFSLGTIREIIHEMRTEQFQFKPVRTTFIPKANGKMRKLGMPCVRDKVVQEVMHMLLEAIYESPHGPYFSDASHGCATKPQLSHGLARNSRKMDRGQLARGGRHSCLLRRN